MSETRAFSELDVLDEFFAMKKGRRIRFRKIDPEGLGDDMNDMNALQVGGGEGLHQISQFEPSDIVSPIPAKTLAGLSPKMGDPSSAGTVHDQRDPRERGGRKRTLAEIENGRSHDDD